MTDTSSTTNDPKFKFDFKDISITAGSSIALYWLFDNYVKENFPYDYREFLTIGLVGGSSITILAPIIDNLINNRDILTGINFDKNLFINLGTNVGLSGILFIVLKQFIDVEESMLSKYVSMIVSVVGSKMIAPYVIKAVSR